MLLMRGEQSGAWFETDMNVGGYYTEISVNFSFFKRPPLSKQTDQGDASLLGRWSQTDFLLFTSPPIPVRREAWPFVNYKLSGKK